MKKIVIMTGELSGDRLAAWYVHRLRAADPSVQIHAVGGDFLEQEGVTIVERFETLNVVGIAEIIAHLPHILRSLQRIATYIMENQFDEVILVDFPGFNLRLARLLTRLRVKAAGITPTITYLSPPQLWVWGAWRVRSLKQYCNKVIVMYPFEVSWYARCGVTATWIGNPVYDQVATYRVAIKKFEPRIALIPGSRRSEIERLLPLFLSAAVVIHNRYPAVRFVLPVARSIAVDQLEALVKRHHLQEIWQQVDLVRDDDEKYTALARCAMAISKPGTVSLELALLRVPTVVVFKISWFTYLLARPLVRVKHMALPNLLLKKSVFPEIIQYGCTPGHIAQVARAWYEHALRQDGVYASVLADCDRLATLLAGADNTTI
jgi:lipid-A-disaccharide synthase